MTALAALLSALRDGNTLPWLLVHAPHGDADRAVREAWEGEKSRDTLVAFIRYWRGERSGDVARAMFPVHSRWCVDGCAWCVEDTRAGFPCPTWAKLTGGER